MNTVMGNAMKEAGIKGPSQVEQVWRYLYDNPLKTADDLRKIMKHIPNMHAIMYDLMMRDMVWYNKEKRRHPSTGRQIFMKVYSVNKKMGNKFELLPKVKKVAKPRPKKDGVFTRAADPQNKAPTVDIALDLNLDSGRPDTGKPAEQAVAVIEPKKLATVYDLDNMTLGELKALYAQLHRMFGV